MGSFLSAPITEKETIVAAEGNGLRAAVSTMQGWRTEMEDADTVEVSLSDIPNHSLFAVFDGHGGKQAAIYSAANILATLRAQPAYKAYVGSGATDPALLKTALTTAFFAVDAALRLCPEVEGDAGDHSGCTAVVAMVTPTHFLVSNAGDSRSILISGGKAVAMSDDHKPDNEGEKARILAANGHVSMRRVDGDLAVSRAFGDFQYKDAALPPENCKVTCAPDVEIRARNPAIDECLVLACDGIWDVMTNDEAAAFLLDVFRAVGEPNLGLICEEMIDHCLNLNSRDNMSVVLVAMPPVFEGANANGGGVAAMRAAREAERESVAAAGSEAK